MGLGEYNTESTSVPEFSDQVKELVGRKGLGFVAGPCQRTVLSTSQRTYGRSIQKTLT